VKIHRQGWPFIAAFVAVNALLLAWSVWAAAAFLPLTFWCLAFFRDPDRQSPDGRSIVSPADGRLLPVATATPPAELGLGPKPLTRLSVFMSVFDVHVNRIPATGVICGLAYRPGKFFNASFDKASEHNERMAIRLRLEETAGAKPREIAFVQIAGLVARRIHCELSEGQRVCRGDRFGIIRFGSRLDIYLPDDARVRVREGQRARAGETVLADFPD
jgi:phosphatidylserine decarboxylase